MSASVVAAFVAAVPKVELHLHLIGSASLDTVLALARRHPDGGVPTDPDALRAFYAFTDFPHFLGVYLAVNRLVRTGADVGVLLDGLAADLAARRVGHAEVTVTAVRNREAGIGYDDLAQALTDARGRALAAHDLDFAWVFDADAALGPAGAEETVDFALRHRPPGTVGIGLGGAEIEVSRADFAPAFRRARDGGLHSVPHAGETVGPAEVWAAVGELGAERIGHGLGAARDPALLAHLAERGITLEICPTSNLCTAAVPTLDEHPLPAILAAGVPVTIATDDPGMFHTDLDAEYRLLHSAFGLGVPAIADIVRSGIRAAFCDPQRRKALLAGVDAAQAAAQPGPASTRPAAAVAAASSAPLTSAPSTVRTARLLLRRPVPADAAAILAGYAADPTVTRFLAWPRHRSIEDSLAFVGWSEQVWATAWAGPYVILDEAGELIGSTALDVETPWRASTGFVLARTAWGRGYATEVTAAMVQVAAGIGVARLFALCHPENRASGRVLAKAGFVREGVLHRHAIFPNLDPDQPCDVECWAHVT